LPGGLASIKQLELKGIAFVLGRRKHKPVEEVRAKPLAIGKVLTRFPALDKLVFNLREDLCLVCAEYTNAKLVEKREARYRKVFPGARIPRIEVVEHMQHCGRTAAEMEKDPCSIENYHEDECRRLANCRMQEAGHRIKGCGFLAGR